MQPSSEIPDPGQLLPDPDDRPGADVVIFDGDCRFCIRQVQRLARWDKGGRLSFLPRKDPRAAQIDPQGAGDSAPSEMSVVDGRGVRHGGASAVRYFSRRLPRLWWAAPLLHVPGSLPLWNWLYRQVARRRHRWSGSGACDTETCDTGACHSTK
jgi:predicted DCC family thiol-disulfide oxidoreductase YuxK